MKNIMNILISSLFLLLFGCASPNIVVRSDSDPSIKLTNFVTYDLESDILEKADNPFYENELNKQRIETVLNKNLGARGYEESETGADLIIAYSFDVKDKVRNRRNYPYDFYYYYPYTLRDFERLEEYEVGELVLSIKDGDSDQVIWVGAAMDILAGGLKGLEERLEKATNELLNAFHEEMISNGSKVTAKR